MIRPKKKSVASGIRTPDLPLSMRTPEGDSGDLASPPRAARAVVYLTDLEDVTFLHCDDVQDMKLVGCLFNVPATCDRVYLRDNFTCCHTEIEIADQTFHLTQSQNTDTGPTSPSTDPITPGAWQGSPWSAIF